MNSVQESVRELVRQDQLRQALDLMDTWIRMRSNSRVTEFMDPVRRDIDLLFGEANRLGRDTRRQLISGEVQAVREARLRDGVLELADELERLASKAGIQNDGGTGGAVQVNRSEQGSVPKTKAQRQSTAEQIAEASDAAEGLTTGSAKFPSISGKSPKPIVFVSYAHADEPETPAEGEIKWLSFVNGYLKPAAKRGAFDIWADMLMRGGDDWDPEIEHKLRTCDIFVLLVSRHSMSSDYIVDKEIAVIRERQAEGEDVHFYPLLLTPTPTIGLEAVRDRNLRPRDMKPFSSYPLNDRYKHMSQAADEIAAIAAEIAKRKNARAAEP